jgi:cyclohexadienyl dehydratase
MLINRLVSVWARLGSALLLGFAVTSCERSAAPVAAPSVTVAPASATVPAPVAPAAAESAVWRVGTTGDYAPFSTRDASGKLQGFDIDLASELARDSHAAVRWVDVRWPGLQAALAGGELDLVMSGVTWQPARSVVGYMTRALARGGPCVLGDAHGTPVAVNRGGVLETWARAHFPENSLVTVDDNQSLPGLLASGRVRAVVTDSFELHAFARPEWPSVCEPRLARKVYWIAPGHEALARAIDGWLGTHAERVQAAQVRWFGERQSLRALDHLSDLLARRLAFMPLVAEIKAKAGLPIEDLPREKQVLAASEQQAQKLGLRAESARRFFALQIELAKAVQRRRHEPTELDLARQIRPALNELGDRILDALGAAVEHGELASATLADLDTLTPWLEANELRELLDALHAFGT